VKRQKIVHSNQIYKEKKIVERKNKTESLATISAALVN